jgi:hypothetical protein
MTKQKTLKENRKGHRATKPSQAFPVAPNLCPFSILKGV